MQKEYYNTYPTLPKTSSTPKRTEKTKKKDVPPSKGCCKCMSPKTKSKTKACFAGLATNLGICILLFGYTLIGSVIFLAIEGGGQYQYQQILATTSKASNPQNVSLSSNTLALIEKNERARAKTVENIWDITVSLNILYRDNWTKLAALEITRFQEELVKNIAEDAKVSKRLDDRSYASQKAAEHYEWTFAKAFLYSLTVLTTIGYGSVAPTTNLGKIITMVYAMLGIPLTLLYLSSIGTILSRVARGVFSRALCCCLCSNCGYCCYDEKKMQEKERRKRRKRQQQELQQQLGLQEPFYVRSNSSYSNNINSNACSMKDLKEIDNLSTTDNESKLSIHGWSILAPVLLCLTMMFIYICIGTFVLFKLENWSLLDGFYFCFMSLTTIGFGNMVPGNNYFFHYESNTTIWFCSIYIISGMALTAMSFNVVHDEIVCRLKHHEIDVPDVSKVNSTSFSDDLNISDPYSMS